MVNSAFLTQNIKYFSHLEQSGTPGHAFLVSDLAGINVIYHSRCKTEVMRTILDSACICNTKFFKILQR